jgi:hypothetical protein
VAAANLIVRFAMARLATPTLFRFNFYGARYGMMAEP